MSPPILWYFADPMCSWCWGFTPVIEAVRDAYRERMKIALVLGGLRHDTTPMSPAQRDEILHHWHAVQARTGQPFRFDGALPPGFVYDTEPACRAVATVAGFNPSLIFPMFKAIQTAFYAQGRDVTQPDVLADVAAETGVSRGAFRSAFDGEAARHRTQAHFRHARQAGVRGFPTLIVQHDAKLDTLSQGCESLESVRAAIDATLPSAA